MSAIATVREFNRFYTSQIGLLQNHFLGSAFSLTEARVLYEIAHRDGPSASELSKELRLDAGYLSRIIRSFEKRGLVHRKASKTDGRQSHHSLTGPGRKVFGPLEKASDEEVAVMLSKLVPEDQQRIIGAMRTIQQVLEPKQQHLPYLLRPHQPGDMGWVIHRHGALYSQEYGWDERFEALVAEIAAKFIQHFDPKRERCWIAEKDGAIVGSIFLVKKSVQVAKLRLLLVEPSARGLGIGNRLVEECVRFARQAGYKKITLWTQSILRAAIHLYQRAGFQLVHEEQTNNFGFDLTSQTWELDLYSH